MSKLSRLTEPAMARIPAIAPQRETQIHASTTVEDIVANSGDYISCTRTIQKTSNSQTPLVCDAEF
jgi:hypothetical protein